MIRFVLRLLEKLHESWAKLRSGKRKKRRRYVRGQNDDIYPLY